MKNYLLRRRTRTSGLYGYRYYWGRWLGEHHAVGLHARRVHGPHQRCSVLAKVAPSTNLSRTSRILTATGRFTARTSAEINQRVRPAWRYYLLFWPPRRSARVLGVLARGVLGLLTRTFDFHTGSKADGVSKYTNHYVHLSKPSGLSAELPKVSSRCPTSKDLFDISENRKVAWTGTTTTRS